MVVDPERFENDKDEEMAKKGMGAIYTKTSDGWNLRMKPGKKEREELLKRFYRPYHQAMEQEVEDHSSLINTPRDQIFVSERMRFTRLPRWWQLLGDPGFGFSLHLILDSARL